MDLLLSFSKPMSQKIPTLLTIMINVSIVEVFVFGDKLFMMGAYNYQQDWWLVHESWMIIVIIS